MDLRRCTTADTELIARLGRETYRENYAHLNDPERLSDYLGSTFSLEKTRAELTDPHSFVYLITEDRRPAAFLKLNLPPSQSDFNEEGTMELQRIYVLEGFKGRGYGKRLIELAVSEAEAQGCRSIWLSVWEKNPRAISFYQKMGFCEDGKRFFRMGEELQSDLVLRYQL